MSSSTTDPDTKTCQCQCPCNCPNPTPTPNPEPNPNPTPEPQPTPEDLGHEKEGGWGSTDDNPHNWSYTPMKDDKTKFKVVDKNKVNRRDLFDTEAGAKKFIADKIVEYDKKHSPPPPEPKPEPNPDNSQNKDKNGVIIMAKIKAGGETVSEVEVERSVHNQSNEKNIQRDSIYAKPNKFTKNKTVNLATVAYIKTKLTKSDQIDFKRCGGKHSDSGAKQGRCYPVGIMVNLGKPTTGYIAKEYPQHSDTPKFIDKIKYATFKEIPDVNDKLIGLQTVGYVTPQNTYKILCYIDRSVMDKEPEDLVSPPNKWELFYTAEDKGDWEGEPYLTNQGIENGGDSMFVYGRVDHVSYETKVKFCGGVEIEPLTE